MLNLSDEQVRFLKDQAQNKVGRSWLEVIQRAVDDLYYSKGISPDEVIARQRAAELLEQILNIAKDVPHAKRSHGNDYV